MKGDHAPGPGRRRLLDMGVLHGGRALTLFPAPARLPLGPSLPQFVLDTRAELGPEGRGMNRGGIDVDTQGGRRSTTQSSHSSLWRGSSIMIVCLVSSRPLLEPPAVAAELANRLPWA